MADIIDKGIELTKSFGKTVLGVKDVIISSGKSSSLTRMTKDATFQFPIIMDNDIDNDEKGPIIKDIERAYANIVLLAISNAGWINRTKYDDTEGTTRFLRKFHTNASVPVRESFNVTDATVTEGYLPREELMSMWDSVEDQLVMESLNDLYLPFNNTAWKMKAAMEQAKYFKEQRAAALEAETYYYRREKYRRNKNTQKVEMVDGMPVVDDPDDYQYIRSNSKGTHPKYGEAKTMTEWARLDNEEREKRKIEKPEEPPQPTNLHDLQRRGSGTKSEIVLDRENRLFSMTPTILKFTIANKTEDGDAWFSDVVVGVKAMPRFIKKSSMIASMVDAFKDRLIFQFIKWTKGEFKWADFFFNISEQKNAAIGDNRWLRVLRRRAKLNRFRPNKLNPNCTIIITDSDAYEIQRTCGINVNDPANVQRMMQKHFLLAFGIYDTEAKMLKIMFDGDEDFSQTSLRAMINNVKKDIQVGVR